MKRCTRSPQVALCGRALSIARRTVAAGSGSVPILTQCSGFPLASMMRTFQNGSVAKGAFHLLAVQARGGERDLLDVRARGPVEGLCTVRARQVPPG